MVCKECRSVETVDVGVGDEKIVETVDVGVGDGVVDPDWLPKLEPLSSRDRTSDSEKPENLAVNALSTEECEVNTQQYKTNNLKIKIRSTKSASLKRKSLQAKKHWETDCEEEDEVQEEEKKDDAGGKKIECTICRNWFRKSYLEHHVRSHNKERPHCCEKCGKKFANKTYFKNHRQKCLENSDSTTCSSYQCSICQSNLSSKAGLDEHLMRMHSNGGSFQCHICPKIFKQYPNLRSHLKTHSDSRPFGCDICEKSFRYKRSLEQHKTRFHEGIRETFQCEICGLSFHRKDCLKVHLDKHLGITRYKCDFCDKRFFSGNVLRTHLLIHEEKKRFSCADCGKEFRQGSDLKRHLTTHTGIKPFRCEACGKQFIHKVYLVRHKCAQTVAMTPSEMNGGAEKLLSSRKKKTRTNAETAINSVVNNRNLGINTGNNSMEGGGRAVINNHISAIDYANMALYGNDLFSPIMLQSIASFR